MAQFGSFGLNWLNFTNSSVAGQQEYKQPFSAEKFENGRTFLSEKNKKAIFAGLSPIMFALAGDNKLLGKREYHQASWRVSVVNTILDSMNKFAKSHFWCIPYDRFNYRNQVS